MIKPFYIIGFMGTGKSSLKRYLEISDHAIDLDEMFEAHVKMDISTYFEHYGEDAFRLQESKLLQQANAAYIVTGGGIVERDDNFDLMRERGVIIALDLPYEMCWDRIKDSDRPLVRRGKTTVEALYARRRPLYARADYVLDASLSTEVIAQTLYQIREEDT
ncbi:shikimate kinase [Exiguobacterium sp. TNDT2]|uniref:shikimate kinase n=1 Tax=Exiguobacterium sp. TNDT2 TaxID=2233531 RepID=UPI001E2F7A08|nr:shikimate kinase [Exiguobacterium sp. TNDT2]